MEDTENPAQDPNGAGEAPRTPRITAGQMLRDARLRAGIPISKVSADLRISTSILESVEAGDYSKLAGAPYVRALLVSLSRYLHLDSRDVLEAYSEESGVKPAEVAPVSPYKDDSKTHARAHKQIFILLLAVLLFVLLLIMGKVNSSSGDDEVPVPAPGNSDTLLNIDPVTDSDSLLLDSLRMDTTGVDSLAMAGDTAAVSAVKPAVKSAAADTVKAATQTAPATSTAKEPTTVRIQALSDSVYIRVLRAGKRESSRTLAPGQSIDVRHDDVITFITRASNSVEVSAGGTVVIPDKRRFKVAGSAITY